MNNTEKNTYVKQQITNAFLQMLEKHNIKDVSVSDLCDKAGVGRASFYRYYESKEDVIRQYSDYLI